MNENQSLRDDLLPVAEELREEMTEAAELSDEEAWCENAPCVEDAPTDEEAELPDYGCEIESMRREFPDLISPADGERYATLRALGLTPKEAYLATSSPRTRSDTRAHLGGGIPKRAYSPYNSMTRQALESARALFEGLGDAEIQRLYKRVTK